MGHAFGVKTITEDGPLFLVTKSASIAGKPLLTPFSFLVVQETRHAN